MPPELKPLPRTSISLTMENDAKIVYETIAKLAGITVIFDPDFPARRIPAKLNNVTLQQALDIVSLESKAFWKPVTENIIFVVPDQPAKRHDYEENCRNAEVQTGTVERISNDERERCPRNGYQRQWQHHLPAKRH